MSLKKAAGFLGAFKFIFILAVCSACASKPELAPSEHMKFLDQELDSSFSVRKILTPSKKKSVPLKEGQWVNWSTHTKGKTPTSSFSTLRVLKVGGGKVLFEVETHQAGINRIQKSEYSVRQFPRQMLLGLDRNELSEFKKKITFEKIKVQNGGDKPIEISHVKGDSIDEHLFRLIFQGVRTSKVVSEKCETEFLQSTRCLAYDYEIDRIRYRSRGRVWVHSSIPVMGIVRAEDESSVVRVIQFGEKGKQVP